MKNRNDCSFSLLHFFSYTPSSWMYALSGKLLYYGYSSRKLCLVEVCAFPGSEHAPTKYSKPNVIYEVPWKTWLWAEIYVPLFGKISKKNSVWKSTSRSEVCHLSDVLCFIQLKCRLEKIKFASNDEWMRSCIFFQTLVINFILKLKAIILDIKPPQNKCNQFVLFCCFITLYWLCSCYETLIFWAILGVNNE